MKAFGKPIVWTQRQFARSLKDSTMPWVKDWLWERTVRKMRPLDVCRLTIKNRVWRAAR